MLGSVQHRNSLFGKNNKVEEMKMRKGKRQNLKDNAAQSRKYDNVITEGSEDQQLIKAKMETISYKFDKSKT